MRLLCTFQRLEGEATSEGLCLNSTAVDGVSDRFLVVASSVGRTSVSTREKEPPARTSSTRHDPQEVVCAGPSPRVLARTGMVKASEGLLPFIRPGLVEECSVSRDGIRQDFVIMERPGSDGELRLELDLRGARAEQADYGARLLLNESGRTIA